MIILLFFRYYPSSNDILINVETQNISIINSNIIGKYLVPKVEINFNDVTKITNEKVSVRGQGVNSYYSRIYIHSFDKKIAIIDLLNGPFYFIDYKAFMYCFAGILGKKSLTSIK